jgi:16S rRNA processing protein RimM
LQGEVNLQVYTDFPERLKRGRPVYVGKEHQPLRIQSARQGKRGLLLTFVGYDTPEAVGELRNQILFVSEEGLPPLAEGEYYHHQVVGLRVVDEAGKEIGHISEVIDNPANDIYLVKRPGASDVLLPATEEVILDIDLEKKEMQVHLLEGLLPD